MVNPRELIRIARQLAAGDLGSSVGRPRQADLRRAVSAVYYALFHALAACAADTLIGTNPASRIETLWLQTYRTLEHGQARERCQGAMVGLFPSGIQDFARQFVEMQGQRHDADYNPGVTFTRREVRRFIDETERRIVRFEGVPEQARRAFAVYVLFRIRSR